MERVAMLSDAPVVTAAILGLPPAIPRPAPTAARSASRERSAPLERERLRAALERAGGNLSQAAAELRIPRNTLRYRLSATASSPIRH